MNPRSASKKNPLYVVTNSKRGSVVEEASGLFDMIVKKFGLTPLVEMIEGLMASLLQMVTSYAMFEAIKKMIDDLVMQMNLLLAPILGARSSGKAL